MDRVLSTLKQFGQFWYDFVVGDDWKIAAAVVAALAVGAAIVAGAATDATWPAPAAGAVVLLAFTVGVVADLRGRG
jgi:membrane protein YdbS with pleckstrin-like domain